MDPGTNRHINWSLLGRTKQKYVYFSFLKITFGAMETKSYIHAVNSLWVFCFCYNTVLFKGFYDLYGCFWARSWYNVNDKSTHITKLFLPKIRYLLSTCCHDSSRNFVAKHLEMSNISV